MHVDDKAGVGVLLPGGGGGENEGLSVQLSFVECHVAFRHTQSPNIQELH